MASIKYQDFLNSYKFTFIIFHTATSMTARRRRRRWRIMSPLKLTLQIHPLLPRRLTVKGIGQSTLHTVSL